MQSEEEPSTEITQDFSMYSTIHITVIFWALFVSMRKPSYKAKEAEIELDYRFYQK